MSVPPEAVLPARVVPTDPEPATNVLILAPEPIVAPELIVTLDPTLAPELVLIPEPTLAPLILILSKATLDSLLIRRNFPVR